MSVTQQEDTTEEMVEALAPEAEEVDVTVGVGDYERTYTMRPLSFFQKMELVAVIGKALDQAMAGDEGLSLDDLLEVEGFDGEIDRDSMKDADLFVRSIAKLAQYAPDLLEEVYCIALGVPRGRRKVAKEIMTAPEALGGLTDDQGILILETFIDQNLEVLVDFFTVRLMPVLTRIGKKTGLSLTPTPTEQDSSTPSKPSAQTTASE
jgi:hypothetical protein